MATTIDITGSLTLDETAGLQDNDVTISNTLTGLSTDFRTYLLSLSLSADQLNFADSAEAAISGPDFVTVTPDAGNVTINNLFFSDGSGNALNGDQVFLDNGTTPLQTINGDNVYLWSYENGSIVLAKTAGGDVVAAFYLNAADTFLSASIEMVTFTAFAHPDPTNPDDSIDFSDILNVSATGSLSFEFDTLKSGKFLWVAVGDDTHGLLVTGMDLNVNASGDRVSGGQNPSDAINTSQGGDGATIGIDNQMFVPGETAVFTLVDGFGPLGSGPDATGDNVTQIDYDSYLNTQGAGVYISQKQGNTKLDLTISVNEAGGGTTPEEGFNYIGTEPSGAFIDDTPVNVKTVSIYNGSQLVGTWSIAPTGTQHASGFTVGTVQVTINGNDIDVNGVDALYTISWTVVDGETFNRFELSSDSGKFDVGRIDVAQGVTITTPVGNDLFVDDDGPTLSGQTASVRVEEDELSVAAADGDQSTGNTDGDAFTDEAIFTNASLQTILTVGADKPATFALNLSSGLNGTAVVDTSGVAVKSQGDAVTYLVVGSVVEGVASDGRVVFTLTQTAGDLTPDDPTDDAFTLDLKDQIDHATASGDSGTRTLDLTPAFTAADADGDPVDLNGPNNDKRPIQVVVENDVPIPTTATTSVRVVEDALAVADGDNSNGLPDGDGQGDEAIYTYANLQTVVTTGADEPITFALNLSSGLNGTAVVDTNGVAVKSQGDAVTYLVVGSVVEGVASDGRVVFTLTQTLGNLTTDDPTDDAFTLDLKDQIDHLTTGEEATRTLDLTPAFTAKDFDGDPADLNGTNNDLRPIQAVVENDVPTITAQILDGIVDFAAGSSVTHSLNGAIGGDDNDASNQTSDGTKTYTFTDYQDLPNYTEVLSSDATKVEYYSGSTLFYDITLNQSGAGSYTFTVHQPPPNDFNEFDFTDLPSGQNLFGVIAADKTDLSGLGLLVIGSSVHLNPDGTYDTSGADASDTINTSKGGGPVTIGIGNQMFDPSEGAYFVYLDNPDDDSVAGVPGGLTQNTADDADTIGFAGTQEAHTASVEVVQVQGGKSVASMDITAFNINATNVDTPASRIFAENPIATDDQVNITAVRVYNSNGVLIESWADTNLDGIYEIQDGKNAAGITVTFTEDHTDIFSARVTGFGANYTIEFDTQTAHDVALIEDVSGKWDIGGFNVGIGQDTPDQSLDFTVQISDYDGDVAGGAGDTFASFSVGIDGTGIYDDGLITV